VNRQRAPLPIAPLPTGPRGRRARPPRTWTRPRPRWRRRTNS